MVTLSNRRERADQLAQVLEGRLDATEAPRDVRQLATLASTVTTELTIPVLEAEARDRIRTRILAEIHTEAHAAAAGAVDARRTRRRVVVATGVASVLVGASGMAVAAQQALPGDALYGIKQATESVRVAVAGDLAEQGRLELSLATERLEEVTGSVDRGDVRDEAIIETLARMDARSRAGAEALMRVAERSGDPGGLDEVAAFTEQQARGLADVFDRLPVTVRPHAEDSLAVLRAIRADLLGAFSTDAAAAFVGGNGALADLLRSAPLPAAPAVPVGDNEAGDTDPAPAPDGSTVTDGAPTAPSLPGPNVGRRDDGADLRTVVPRLPGPLDDLGRVIDETVGGVLEGTGDLVEDTTGAVDEVLDGTGEVVDGLLDGATGLLDDDDGGGGLLGGAGGGN